MMEQNKQHVLVQEEQLEETIKQQMQEIILQVVVETQITTVQIMRLGQ